MSDMVVESGIIGDSQPRDGGEDDLLVEEELLVEEVSIDGMCGVY